MGGVKDDRFSHILSDPRFRAPPKSVRKVKIDKRFQSLFTDKRFHVKYSVDKRGRPVQQSSHENFRKYYDLSSEDSSDEGNNISEGYKEEENETSNNSTVAVNDGVNNKNLKIQTFKTNKWVISPSKIEDKSSETQSTERNNIKTNKKTSVKEDDNFINELDEIEKARMTDEIKIKLRDPNIDYARGMGTIVSDSSSEEESSEDSESDEDVDHGWGELDKGADTTEEATDRVAVLHMDWDRIRAVDLMVLFNSFLPPDGIIESVTSKEGKRYHMEKLRQYQLNRLKYYYAIIKFDSIETANKVYTDCDGLEYESSATKLDLRFVPSEETFDQEPREVCTAMPDPAKYQPRIFTNTALQQGKVELTWDETDPARVEFNKKIQKNADNIEDADLRAYLAYSSAEEEEDSNEENNVANAGAESDLEDEKEEDKITRYKSLLASLEEEEEKKKNRDVDLEITWGVGLKEKAEKSIKEKMKTPQTPFEEMIEKRKQKKKLKRENKIKLRENNKQESDGEDNEDDIESADSLPSDIDLNDPYFREEFKGSNTTSKKKKNKKQFEEGESEETKQKKAELELLLMDENESEHQKSHFSMKSIEEEESGRKKKKRRKQLKKKPQEVTSEKDDFQVDVSDERFGAIYTSHLFNIDPADPQFRKTKAMEALHQEKLRRRQYEHQNDIPTTKQPRTDPELSLLVTSIKNKTKHKNWK